MAVPQSVDFKYQFGSNATESCEAVPMQLNEVKFLQDFVSRFPGDMSGVRASRPTPGVLYSSVQPTPVASPKLVAWTDELARRFDLASPDSTDIAILGGNLVTSSMNPFSACYAGHQFGNWAGQLGDGRAIILGEMRDCDGQSWELQLKGAGPTPYSRRADGRAVFRSSMREYVMSEAMHALGIPSTRALSLVTTGESVERDMFYDGNPKSEPGAIVARMAPSFLRFGNFEMLVATQQFGLLEQLVRWTIERYFPGILEHGDLDTSEATNALFAAVCTRTSELIIGWQRVGFVHGVMNTDNMSVLGLTIDYGPYAMLDEFQNSFTPNTTDLPGRRYAYGQQPSVAFWNLVMLANALAPLCSDTENLRQSLGRFQQEYALQERAMKLAKIGIAQPIAGDDSLADELDELLEAARFDFTIFYQTLANWMASEGLSVAVAVAELQKAAYTPLNATIESKLNDWLTRYSARISAIGVATMAATMAKVNPCYIARNYQLHQAIEQGEAGDFSYLRKILKAMATPYMMLTEFSELYAKRPGWANDRPGCSQLSCSS